MYNSFIISVFNKILNFFQYKLNSFYESSFILKNIDSIIFFFILLTFGLSVFAVSDLIGYLALVAFFLTIIKISFKKGEKFKPNLFELILILYLLTVFISLMGSSLYILSFKGFLKTFTYLSFYMSLVFYLKDNKGKIPYIFLFLGILVSIESVIGVLQNFNHIEEISTWQDISNINEEDIMTRVYGSLKPFNPNLFGGYLIAAYPTLIFASIYSFLKKHKKTCILSSLMLFLSLIVILMTGCRGAYLAVVGSALILMVLLFKFIQNNQKLKTIYYSVISALFLSASFLICSISRLRTRFLSIFTFREDSSTSFRMNVYQSAFDMVKDNFWLGIGIGNQNFREIYGLYMKTGYDALSAYSIYLETIVESGIFALIFFILFIGIVLYYAIKFLFSNAKNLDKAIILTAFISILGMLIHGFVDTVFYRPQIQIVFWLMVAVLSAETQTIENK